MKTRPDNDVIDCIGPLYTENKIELSWPIQDVWSMMKTKLDNDVIDRVECGVSQKPNRTMMWQIVQVRFRTNMKLNARNRSNKVPFMMMTRQDKDDWLYRCDLHQNPNWTIMSHQTWCSLSQKVGSTMTWTIV